MVKLADRVKVLTPTVGTGTLTLGSAVSGYQSFAAGGIGNGDTVRYVIEEGLNWEIGTGTYNTAGPSLTRTVLESTNADNAISLTGNAAVYLTASKVDLQPAADMDQGVSTTDSPSFVGLALGGVPVTATAAELNVLDGITANTAELNILDGVTANKDELNVLDGITASTAELNILDGVTASAAELNILDGVTASTAELNILDGVTATASELNVLDGVTASTAELNILDGVTASTAELNILDGVTASTAELNYLDITTLGTSQASKVVTADANGVVTLADGLNEGFTAVTSSAGATTVNCRTGNVFSHTLTENTTFTFSNPPSGGTAYGFTLKLVQDSTARTVTWPASVDWSTGVAPTLSAGSGDVDVFVFFTHDAGTTWYGFTAGQGIA